MDGTDIFERLAEDKKGNFTGDVHESTEPNPAFSAMQDQYMRQLLRQAAERSVPLKRSEANELLLAMGPTLKWRQLRQGLERAWKRAHKWHNDENFTDATYNDGSDISWNQNKTPTPAGISSYPSARKSASRNRGAVRSWNRGASWA